MGDRLFDESVYFSSSASSEGGEVKAGGADTENVVSKKACYNILQKSMEDREIV